MAPGKAMLKLAGAGSLAESWGGGGSGGGRLVLLRGGGGGCRWYRNTNFCNNKINSFRESENFFYKSIYLILFVIIKKNTL